MSSPRSASASGSRPACASSSPRAQGDVFTGLLDRFGGAYGRVEGASWTAAFVAPAGGETEAGYVGEAFILEATRLGLGTCWVAGMFDRATATGLAELEQEEEVVALTPVGHPLERQGLRRAHDEHGGTLGRPPSGRGDRPGAGARRRAGRRRALAGLGGERRGGGAPGPSGADRQPWRFRMERGALVLSSPPPVLDHPHRLRHRDAARRAGRAARRRVRGVATAHAPRRGELRARRGLTPRRRGGRSLSAARVTDARGRAPPPVKARVIWPAARTTKVTLPFFHVVYTAAPAARSLANVRLVGCP